MSDITNLDLLLILIGFIGGTFIAGLLMVLWCEQIFDALDWVWFLTSAALVIMRSVITEHFKAVWRIFK